MQAQSGDFPHLLVYGPSGAGKKTRIVATLKELYGTWCGEDQDRRARLPDDKQPQARVQHRGISLPLEITPSDVGNYDRVVVQDLLKEVAQTQQG